ncbi:MAG: ROK family protein [Opitutaceae bacterium]|nr:ROK family protein [Opitutaceae bacterium]
MKPPRSALGIDIGGTKIAIGVIAADGRVLASRALPTESRRGTTDATARITTTARLVLHESGLDVEALVGVGIGCSGPVAPLSGEINNPHTLPGWEGWNIVASLAHTLGLPVWLENDADAAALGEYCCGSGRGAERLVMLTVGTGIGGAIIVDGEIYRGAGGEHPEIGHIPVAGEGPECYCGRSGCLESLLSGTAIGAAGQRLGFSNAADVFHSAKSDQRAQQILTTAQRALESAIGTIVHSFAPDRIVLGGGLVAAQKAFFLEAGRTALGRVRLLPPNAVTLAAARLGNFAGIIGAGRWATQRAESQPSRRVPLRDGKSLVNTLPVPPREIPR